MTVYDCVCMDSQCFKYLCTSMYFKVLKSTIKHYKYIKYISWYLSISTSTMVKFKRYSSTSTQKNMYSSTSTNVLGPMPAMLQSVQYSKCDLGSDYVCIL